MERGEYSEEGLRRFVGEQIDELDNDAKINLYKILMEYFLLSNKRNQDFIFTLLPNPGEGKNQLYLGFKTDDEEMPSPVEKLTSRIEKVPIYILGVSPDDKKSFEKDKPDSDVLRLLTEIHGTHRQQYEILQELNEKVGQLVAKTNSLSAEMHQRYILESFNIDTSEYPVYKFLPIKVYFSEHPNEKLSDIILSLTGFIDSIGFAFADEFPSKTGSWWKSWIGKSKQTMSSEEFTDRLKKGERAIELAALDKVQSEVNKNNSEAASNLIGALAEVDNAAIQIGSLLLVKVTSGSTTSIHTRQLSNKEMILLERNQSLLHNPTSIIEQLEKLSCESAA